MSKTEDMADRVHAAIAEIRTTIKNLSFDERRKQKERIILNVAEKYRVSTEYLVEIGGNFVVSNNAIR